MNKTFATKRTKLQYVKRVIKKIIVLIMVCISAIIIFTSKPDSNLIKKIHDGVMIIINPVIYVMSWPFRFVEKQYIKISNAFTAGDKIPALIEKLKQQNEELSKLKYVKSENIQLKKQLNFIPEYALQYITAPVRLNDSGYLSQSFIIDAGENLGIQEYQPAVVNGAFVGQVTFVGSNYSRINLITDSRSSIPVMIERNRVRAFLVGDNSKYPKLINFETKDPVKVGDRVITSGLEEHTPKGIVIGVVIQDNIDDGILVQPIIDKSEIEFVKIIKKIIPQRYILNKDDNLKVYKYKSKYNISTEDITEFDITSQSKDKNESSAEKVKELNFENKTDKLNTNQNNQQ